MTSKGDKERRDMNMCKSVVSFVWKPTYVILRYCIHFAKQSMKTCQAIWRNQVAWWKWYGIGFIGKCWRRLKGNINRHPCLWMNRWKQIKWIPKITQFLEINDSDFKWDEVECDAYLWSLTIRVNWFLANWNLKTW